jgi:hypothetical protein
VFDYVFRLDWVNPVWVQPLTVDRGWSDNCSGASVEIGGQFAGQKK